MHIAKKPLALILCLIFALALAAGCGGKTEPAKPAAAPAAEGRMGASRLAATRAGGRVRAPSARITSGQIIAERPITRAVHASAGLCASSSPTWSFTLRRRPWCASRTTTPP